MSFEYCYLLQSLIVMYNNRNNNSNNGNNNNNNNYISNNNNSNNNNNNSNRGAGCSSVVEHTFMRSTLHGGPIDLFLIPTTAPPLV